MFLLYEKGEAPHSSTQNEGRRKGAAAMTSVSQVSKV